MGSDAEASEARHMRAFLRVRSMEAAAVAGVVYSVLAVVALILLQRFPSVDLSDEEISAWFDEPGKRGSLLLALNLAAISSIAFLWFIAVIRRRLGDLEDRFFATVFLGSGIAYVVVWVIGAAAGAAPAVATTSVEGASVSADSASLAAGIGVALILVVAPRIQAVFILTTSTVILRSEVLPRWLAVFGYVTGLILLFMPLISEPLGIGFPVWVCLVSVVILSRRPAVLGARSRSTS